MVRQIALVPKYTSEIHKGKEKTGGEIENRKRTINKKVETIKNSFKYRRRYKSNNEYVHY